MSASPDDYPPAVRDRMQPERDPTRTVTLRRKFRQRASKRLRTVRGDLRATIAQHDALHLTDDGGPRQRRAPDSLADLGDQRRGQSATYRPQSLVPPGADDATRDAAVADWFRDVLAGRVVTPDSAEAARTGDGWWAAFIRQAYIRGLGLAVADAKAADVITADDTQYDPTDAFTTERHQTAVAEQYLQTYNDVENVGDATHTEVVRELGDALAAGVGAHALAGRLTGRVEAVAEPRLAMVANTRVVDTVNRAIIEHSESMGATELGGMPEAGERRGEEYQDHRDATWATAGDNRVCAQCALLAGRTATVEEIKKGNAPQPVWDTHPNCRCRYVVLG